MACDDDKDTSNKPLDFLPMEMTQGGTAGTTPENMGGESGQGGSPNVGGEIPEAGSEPIDNTCSDFELNGTRLQVTEDGGYQTIGIRNLDDGISYDLLFVELHTERGLAWEPGVHDLSAVGADYDTCKICVVGIQNINPQAQTDGGYMMADSGTVEIVEVGDSAGDNFLLRFGAVEMRNVTLQSSAGRTVAETVIGGNKWCTQGMEITGTIPRTERPASINEQIDDFSLLNCGTEQMESFAELSSTTNSIWMMGTAGWCPACRDLLQYGDMRARNVASPLVVAAEASPEQLKLMLILSENPLRQEPSLRYCQRYARQYAVELGLDEDFVTSTFYIDHDGVGGFPTLFAYMNPYTDADGAFGLPWNAFVEGRDARTYLYADRGSYTTPFGAVVELPPSRLGELVSQYTSDQPIDGGTPGMGGAAGSDTSMGGARQRHRHGWTAGSDTGMGGVAGSDTGMGGTAGSDTGMGGAAGSDTGMGGAAGNDTGMVEPPLVLVKALVATQAWAEKAVVNQRRILNRHPQSNP